MDKKKVRKWVKALESGKYKQAKGELHKKRTGGYCCLGVACAALLGDEHPDGSGLLTSWKPDEPYHKLGAEELGLSEQNEIDLISLNDAGKKPFPYIARWIRKNLLGEDVIIDVDAYNRRRGIKGGDK